MTERSALCFTGVEVRRTPGIPRGFALDGLAPGINLVYGPNGSGKTTTAELIHALIWPEALPWPHAAFAGSFTLDGADWRVIVDAGHRVCQRAGVAADLTEPAPADDRARYLLTLHDLLRADETRDAFASAILKESAGGYDLDAALQALAVSDRASRPANLIRNVERAQEAVAEARRAQQTLQQQEQTLGSLRETRDAARAAQARLRLLEHAREYVERRQALDEATHRFNAFNPAMGRLVGNERETLERIRERLRSAQERQAEAEAILSAARDMLAQSGLQPDDVEPRLIETLRQAYQRLRDHDLHRQRTAEEVAAAGELRVQARRRIGDETAALPLDAIDAEALRRLAELVREIESARHDQEAVDALMAWLGSPATIDDIDTLYRGINLLNEWLRSPQATSSGRAGWVLLAAAALIAVESVALGIAVHPLFFVLVVAAALLPLLGRAQQGEPGTEAAQRARERFSRLGLEQPAAWETEEVEKVLDRLIARYAQGRIEQERASRMADLAHRRGRVEEQLRTLEQRHQQATAGLSVPTDSGAALYHAAQAIAEWQQANASFEAGMKRLTVIRQESKQFLDAINERLSRFGYEPATDHDVIHGLIEDLAGRINRAVQATQQADQAQRDIAQARQDAQRAEEEIHDLFARLDLTPDDEPTLLQWLDDLPAYREAQERLRDAQTEARIAGEALEGHPELSEVDLHTLEQEIAEVSAQAATYDELNQRITEIETRIKVAKAQNDLETALAEEKEALDALAEHRASDYARGAGAVLGEFVREQTRDSGMPQVFHRARAIFADITRGRYRLEFNTSNGTFWATDRTLGLGQRLDELSAATRLQLLIAVRVAFVEVNERGPKLPLLLDEALGNSDEQRAEALIEAAVQIARSGRQVFYFTAQHDEVGKWRAVLAEHPDVPHEVFNLAEIRALADYDHLPLAPPVSVTGPLVPPPSGMSRHEYGRALSVPAIDPWAGPGAVHLWHLVPDLDALHALLEFRVTTWGQLSTLIESGGHLPPVVAPMRQAIEDRAEIVSALLNGWRIGRGKPVDRAVILESRVISDRFIDQVSDLAASVDGDARAVIAALENRQIRSFHTRTTENFRAYLTEHGYLDEAEPLSAADLRLRALACPAVAAGRVSPTEVDELMANLGLSV